MARTDDRGSCLVGACLVLGAAVLTLGRGVHGKARGALVFCCVLIGAALLMVVASAAASVVGSAVESAGTSAFPESAVEPVAEPRPRASIVQQADDWPVTDQLGGATSLVVVDGDTMYYDVGPRLVAMNVAEAGRPIERWRSRVILSASLLDVHRSTAIFAQGASLVLAQATPTFPVLAEIGLPGRPDEVSIGDNGLLAAVGVSGGRTNLWLVLVDISDPVHPIVAKELSWARPWFWIPHVACDGNRVAVAYSVGGDRGVAEVLTIDASTPRDANVTARATLPSPFALDVLLDDRLMFLLADDSGGRLHVMDVSDPVSIQLLATRDLANNPTDMKRLDDVLAVSMGSRDGGAGSERSAGRVETWDLAVPSDPVSIGMVEVPDEAASLAAVGDQLYVAVPSAGLQRVDAADPSDLSLAQSWPEWPAFASQVALVPDAVVVHDSPVVGREPLVVLVDHNASESLAVRGVISAPLSHMDPLATGDGFAFFTRDATPDDALDDATALGVIDLRDVDRPISHATDLVVDDPVLDIAADGGYAYLANTNTVLAIDVSDPSEPAIAGRQSDPQVAHDIELDGPRAFVFRCCGGDDIDAWRYWVETIDTDDPTRLDIAYRYELPFPIDLSAEKLVADDGILVVGGRYLMDIHDPGQPVLLSRADRASGRAFTVDVAALSGDRLLLGTYDCLRALDVTDPSHPRQVGAWPIGASDIVLADERVFVAAYEEGMYELSLSHPPMPSFSYSCAPFAWTNLAEPPGTNSRLSLPRVSRSSVR